MHSTAILPKRASTMKGVDAMGLLQLRYRETPLSDALNP